MRVLHFYKTSVSDSMGGVEQVIDHIARGASRHGITSDVLSLTATRGPAIIESHGYTIHRAHLDLDIASTGISFSVFSRFRELARQADLIHYHFPWPFMDVVHFAVGPAKPTVVTYHSDIIRQKQLLRLYAPLRDRFLSSVDRIVTTSPNYFATSDVLKQYADKVDVVPIGLDKDSYPKPHPERLRRWQNRFGPRFFLFVGVLRYYKGLHILMEAARRAPYPIVIAGAGSIERDLREQARTLGVTNVHFVGYVEEEDKVALLMSCSAVLFPSHLRSEAFGISLLEGAMYRKPMISSEIGTGTSYININEETGIVVPPGDPAALAAAMDRLWQAPDLAEAMGKRAEERYWEHFTADRMVKSYVDIYRELLAPRRPRVVVVSNSSWSIQNFRLGLLRGLRARDYDVVTVAPLDSGRAAFKEIGCRMIDLPMAARGTNPLQDLWLIVQLARLYRRVKPDLVIHYTIKPNIYGTLAARLAGVPSLAVTTGLGYIFLTSGTVPWIARQLYRLSLRFPRQVWFLNREDCDEFIERGLVPASRAEVLDSEGVDTDYFAPETRERNDGEVHFLLVARMLWDKGVGTFVEAARALHADFPQARFKLLGPAGVANPSAITRDQLERWEREDGVQYLGETADVRRQIREADCVVLPSFYLEGVPRTLMEAASMARPMIASDVRGCREVVRQGETGLLCEARNVESLANAMRTIISMSPEERRQMGERARKYALSRFDERLTIQRYLDFIETRALGTGTPRSGTEP